MFRFSQTHQCISECHGNSMMTRQRSWSAADHSDFSVCTWTLTRAVDLLQNQTTETLLSLRLEVLQKESSEKTNEWITGFLWRTEGWKWPSVDHRSTRTTCQWKSMNWTITVQIKTSFYFLAFSLWLNHWFTNLNPIYSWVEKWKSVVEFKGGYLENHRLVENQIFTSSFHCVKMNRMS